MENKFKKEDKEKVIEFLNLVAKHARFNMDTTEVINYFKALTYMQKTLLPKIDANIFEIIAVKEDKSESKE